MKFNITEKDGLLTYFEEESYYYEPMGNETSLDEYITTVNPVYFVRYFLPKKFGQLIKLLFNDAIELFPIKDASFADN